MADIGTLLAILNAATSIAGGVLGRDRGGLSPQQKRSEELVDQLLQGVNGQGPYADLFRTDEDAFKKGFVDPSISRFNREFVPQITQNVIASGQGLGGTGLQDQLTRAGVNLNQQLAEQYGNFQQQGQNRMANLLNSVIGRPATDTRGQSGTEAFRQSAAGYLTSDGFGNDLESVLKRFFGNQRQVSDASGGDGLVSLGYQGRQQLPEFQYNRRRPGFLS